MSRRAPRRDLGDCKLTALRILVGLIFILVGLTAAARDAEAHVPAYGIGTQSDLALEGDTLRVTFDLSYSADWAASEMAIIDGNGDGKVDTKEADRALERAWRRRIQPLYVVRLDGQEIAARKTSERHEGLVGAIAQVPFSYFFALEFPFPKGTSAGAHTLTIEDKVTGGETPAKPRFLLPVGEPDPGAFGANIEAVEPVPNPGPDRKLVEAVELTLRIRLGAPDGRAAVEVPPSDRGTVPGGASPGGPEEKAPVADPRPDASRAHPPGATDEGALVGFLSKWESSSWMEALLFLALAFALGAAHALSPGHGKAFVAAYLVGTRGGVKDALVLGAGTTVFHTVSVFALGGLIFGILQLGSHVSQGALEGRIIVVSQLVSSLLLVVLGVSLFVRRLRRLGDTEGSHAHPHAHPHPHPHPHSHPHTHPYAHPHPHPHPDVHAHPHPNPSPDVHDHPREASIHGKPRLRELVSVAFSAGLVPCPAGLTVILLGLQHPQKLPLALSLLVVFALGLGAVLVLLGTIVVHGRRALETRARARDVGLPTGPDAAARDAGTVGLGQPRNRIGRILGILPLVSSAAIAVLGTALFASTCLRSRTEISALFRALAAWIEV